MTESMEHSDGATICEVIELVTSVVLGMHAQPIAPPDRSPFEGEESWTGCVAISGSFSGLVVVSCTRRFAERAAYSMLGSDGCRDVDARDVLAELANILGGNIKSALAEATGAFACLSLPIVTTGRLHINGTTPVHSQWCDVDGDPIVVELLASPRGVMS